MMPMRLILRNMVALTGALVLAACVAGNLGGATDKAKQPNPITGEAIEVTALDGPPSKGETEGKQTKTPAAGAKPAPKADGPVPDEPLKADAPAAEKPAQGPKPKPKPGTEAVQQPLAEPEAMPPVPKEQKSETQLACEKKNSIWSKVGSSGAAICIKRTKDGGKRCTNGKQCEGECLARSGSCSPFEPLLGCNEIFSDSGVRSSLCLN
jgi:outer membrane biosynthesis protein TonB